MNLMRKRRLYVPKLPCCNRRFRYDPETGLLTWKGNVRTGMIAPTPNDEGILAVKVQSEVFPAANVIMKMMRPVSYRDTYVVDHLNGDTTDLRFENLQLRDPEGKIPVESLNEVFKVAQPKEISRGAKRPKPLPPIEKLRDAYVYNPETGVLSNRPRPGYRYFPGYGSGDASTVNGKGYKVVRAFGLTLCTHRVIWAIHYGEDPGNTYIDHINRDPSDNRIANLRLVSAKENAHNKAEPRVGASGIRGVTYVKRTNRWLGIVRRGGVPINVGASYRTKAQAREAVNIVRAELNLPLV